MHLVRYSALTGDKEADLFTEKNEHYVEPQHPVLFLPNNPDQFICRLDFSGNDFRHRITFDDYMKIFAIPSSELASNPELHQNPGYGNATDK